jgi:hypothetical protein
MNKNTNIEIFLDETVKDNAFFQNPNSVGINSSELFKYAVWMLEVPAKVKESDFEYLQSKVPALECLLAEFIEFSTNTIFNLSDDDRGKKNVSEAVGVGLGLKYSTELLGVNPNKFKKIGVPKKGKYLDYSTIVDEKEYEIETKGTVSDYFSEMKKDILAKKNNPILKKVHLRYGTISMLKSKNGEAETEIRTVKSQCVIVDDPPEDEIAENDDTFLTQLLSYAVFLSYILDATNYNRYVKPLKKGKITRVKINDQKFFGKYKFKEKLYYGEGFDYRLIEENFAPFADRGFEKEAVFKELTKKVGVTKIFIGLDEEVISAINERNEDFLDRYDSEVAFIDENESTTFLDRDGILIVKSQNRADRQLEDIFPDAEVERRLGLYERYLGRDPHKCGAPCRSRDLAGKPCEILTYREFCHFHR